MNKYEEAVLTLERIGSVSGAARELGISRKTVVSRVQATGRNVHEFIYPEVRGRNARLMRTMANGERFNFSKPLCTQVSLYDIARGLSRLSWNTGQTYSFYSLAWCSTEFSMYVAKKTRNLELAKLALFAYSHCAYIGYIPPEVERYLTGNYHTFKVGVQEAVYDNFLLLLKKIENEDTMAQLLQEFEDLLHNSIGKDTSVFNTSHSSPRLDEVAFEKHWQSLQAVASVVEAA